MAKERRILLRLRSRMSDSGSVGNAHERAPTLQPLNETARVERTCTLFHHVSVNEARLERERMDRKGWEKDLYTATNQLSSGITRSLERKKKKYYFLCSCLSMKTRSKNYFFQ